MYPFLQFFALILTSILTNIYGTYGIAANDQTKNIRVHCCLKIYLQLKKNDKIAKKILFTLFMPILKQIYLTTEGFENNPLAN